VDHAYAARLDLARRGDLRPGLFSAPLDVHLQVTTHCDLGCHGCYASVPAADRSHLALDLATNILEHLGAWGVFTVALGGGEPLLHPALFDIAREARRCGLVPNMTTNGLRLDERAAKACRLLGHVRLSCHCEADLERLEPAVKELQKQRIQPGLNLLVSSATYPLLPQIVGWAARQRLDQILFLKFKLTSANRACSSLLLTDEQEAGLLPAIRRLCRRDRIMPLLDCSFFPALAAHRPDRRSLAFFDVGGCLGGNAYLAVDVQGRYRPCSFVEESYGDLTSLDPDRWRDSPELVGFRARRLADACPTCTYLELCHGGCRVAPPRACEA
jgi:radical SAM protein with 4Fe4S-binding SPASM domain